MSRRSGANHKRNDKGYGPFLGGQQRAGQKLFLFASADHSGAILAEWPDQDAVNQLPAMSRHWMYRYPS